MMEFVPKVGCLKRNGCGIFCCVIEEEELQLHFDKLVLGCFLDLGLVAFAD